MTYLILNGKKLKPFTCMEFMEEEEEEPTEQTLLDILHEPTGEDE